MSDQSYQCYTTKGGVQVNRRIHRDKNDDEFRRRLLLLDQQPGVLLSCRSEYPGRYRPRDILVVNPPLSLTAKAQTLTVRALNRRGRILLTSLQQMFSTLADIEMCPTDDQIQLQKNRQAGADTGSEEMRTRRSGLFDLLRQVISHFASDQDAFLGLYGAFAYDLAFQLEPVSLRLPRLQSQRDLVLFLPDEIVLHDPGNGCTEIYSYDFICADAQGRLQTTGGLKRHVAVATNNAAATKRTLALQSDHAPGEYAEMVRKAQKCFAQGELFEVVPGQTFTMSNTARPSDIFLHLQKVNPAPYGALINLGEGEHLISASPEMFVRVRQGRVESCPISGTIARGEDALQDARNIQQLLNSQKDEAELSMCTDVDRNDKSRICVPGSVKIIGRRQVELYSRLIHTVDHVEGELQSPFDALDAFLTHTWAVTVTGAPKHRAMQFLEDNEKSARAWYGGAFGFLGFDGNMDTGLTLRTIHLLSGIAHVRVGATLLMDSDPVAEEAETRLKASVLLDVLQSLQFQKPPAPVAPSVVSAGSAPVRLNVFMIDHQDSFVLTLAALFKAQGAQLQTLRPAPARLRLMQVRKNPQLLPDLVVLSPGPGRPADFDCAATLALCEQLQIPVFGVCLGLQAMVEYCGGKLGVLSQVVHGRAGQITHCGRGLFENLPQAFNAGRYHSLHAQDVPTSLEVIAITDKPVPCVMAIEHKSLQWSAVQFHPESLLTMDRTPGGLPAGEQLIRNLMLQTDAAKRLAGIRLNNISAAINT